MEQVTADRAADMEPIDFKLAYEMAQRSARAGSSADEAAEIAARIMDGEAPFLPINAPTGGTSERWLVAHNWLSEMDAKLLQHQVIRTEGWPAVGDLDSPRLLRLSAPLPPWCAELLEKLAPVLGGDPPDEYECDVYACEPGQRTPPLELGEGSAAAILSLGASAALLTAFGEDAARSEAYPFPARNTVALDPRSVLLVERGASEGASDGQATAPWGHCVHSGGRHLSLVFRCTPRASSARK